MINHTILIELRDARDAHEAKQMGHCFTEDKLVSRIFLNKKQSKDELVDTFFHEVAHAYMHWRGHKSSARRERKALAVGKVAAKALKETK